MDACIFCGKMTSYRFEGQGEYWGKSICPACQATKFGTNFNTGWGKDDCGSTFKR